MITNIVFDLGNVLLNYKPFPYLRDQYAPEEAELLFRAIFGSAVWLELDRGMVSNQEAIEKIRMNCSGYDNEICNIINNWPEILTPIAGSIEILLDLKSKGYALYLLSNFHETAFQEVLEKHDFFRCFDGMTVSFQEKIIKPYREIYDSLCSHYRIKPEESVFIDDSLANIEAAEAAGFHTIHFIDPEQMRTELNRMNVIVG